MKIDLSQIIYFKSQVNENLRRGLRYLAPTLASTARVASIVLPLLMLLNLPFAEADSSTEINRRSDGAEQESAISSEQIFSSLALWGMNAAPLGFLALQREQWRREAEDPLHDAIQAEEEDGFKVEDIGKPKLLIQEQTNFKGVSPGSIVIVTKQNKSKDIFISIGQKYLDSTNEWFNATHSGIIAQPKSDTSMDVFEIPNTNTPISRSLYSIEELSYAEELMIFDLSQILPEQEKNSFLRQFLAITDTFIQTSAKIQSDQAPYHFKGIVKLSRGSQLPMQSEDWVLLLDRLLDYHLLEADEMDSYLPKNTQYFCSEFVWQSVQLARLVQKYPALSERVKQVSQEIDILNFAQRREVLEEIWTTFQRELPKHGEDPLFSFSAQNATPAKLMAFAQSHGLQLTRIANPDGDQLTLEAVISRWISKQWLDNRFSSSQSEDLCVLPQDIDYILNEIEIKIREEKPIPKDDASVKCLLDFLSSQTTYSKETLECLIWDCFINFPDEQNCPAACIKKTYTLREKTNLLFTSIFIDHTLNRMISDGQLERFLDEALQLALQQPEKLSISLLLEQLFIVEDLHFLDSFFDPGKILSSTENYFVRQYLYYFLSEEDIYKNFPVGLLGMKKVFEMLGWHYSPPAKRLYEFGQSYLEKRVFSTDLSMATAGAALSHFSGKGRGF